MIKEVYTMKNENMTHVDIAAIEARAHALRAEAARDMVSAMSKWVRRQFTFGTSNTAQNAV
ncbi:MAG: hypothetical protein ACJAX2_002444 [Celeribacter sp.]|jgi:hypothetical protein